jgi:exonuclease III
LNYLPARCLPGYYTPRRNRSNATIIVALLLLSGLEVNPGPPAVHRGDIKFGSLNVHSAVHRAALVHSTIADHNLDLLVLQETWINSDDSAAIQHDIAPDGYNCLHAHRPPPLVPTAGKKRRQVRAPRGGGLAVVYRQELDVKTHRLQSSTTPPTTFERQLLVVKSGKTPGVIVVNVYRPPTQSTAPLKFYEELADLVSSVTTASCQDVIVCGDLNCAGETPSTVDDKLTSVFDAVNMVQMVTSPTRGDNLLDVLACSIDRQLVRGVAVDDNGGISDHRLVKAHMSVSWRRSSPVTYKYRPLDNVDFDAFEAALLSSSLFSDPATSTDRFADQLADVITAQLNKFAPLKTVTRKAGGKPINRFLSQDAKRAKQKRRRLERCWKRTGDETDRRVYRAQCRATNTLINESRRQY